MPGAGKLFSHILVCKREGMRLTPAERRRSQRIHVQIPMFVRGVDAAGTEFLDLTKTLDISATGAFLASPRLLRADQLLNLTIPAPSSPSPTLAAETPPIQARVRRHRLAYGIHLLGVEFLKTLD
jgi:PilZ domain